MKIKTWDACKLEWESATIPKREDLYGEFTVKILTGISHIIATVNKEWTKKIDGIFGTNIIGKSKKSLKVTGLFYMEPSEEVLILEYGKCYNPFPWNRLKDHMKMVDKDKFIGKIYFKFWKEYKFIGYFHLIRIEKEKETKNEIVELSKIAQPTNVL